MARWQLMKGIIPPTCHCDVCNTEYPVEEFDLEEDQCLYCLFPETAKSLPVPFVREDGVPRNVTNQRLLLDELEYIPEVQSEAARKSFNRFKERKYVKKTKRL